ncbi:MAG: 16S rRNA (cytidine(1402)-2'-O)-methyltransferase [Pseudomonadota bacterium]
MPNYVLKGHKIAAAKPQAGLYLAATPIGNLGDVTLRVLETLAGCDLIACEDTRVTAKLLRHFDIKTRTTSYHEHNAAQVGPELLDKIKSGMAIVLVSDAGTPLVSDPGYRLVEEAKLQQVSVTPLPGASSPLAALVTSGLPNEQWCFFGFLPTKRAARLTFLKAQARSQSTLIFFESPNRLVKTLGDMIAAFGENRLVCVARELTKLHEEIVTATLGETLHHFAAKNVKGEIVLLVAPTAEQEETDPKELLLELLKTLPVSQAAAEAASLTGEPKRKLYQLALSLKDGD